MTILRRNLILLWVLCSLLWLALVSEQIHGPANTRDVLAALLPPIILLLAGLGLTRVWERFGKAHWLKLPEHLRRGLTRLYLVVAVPWVAWFGYQIYDVGSRHYWSGRYVSPLFWSLLIVPIGGPILLVVIVWVFAGFRNSAPNTSEGQVVQGVEKSSPHPRTEPTPDVEVSFRPLTVFCSAITDRQMQDIAARSFGDESSKPGQILFMLIAAAAAAFWNRSLKFEGLDVVFTGTNSDVVIVEAMFWVHNLFARLMMKDFNDAVAALAKDERGTCALPKVETNNLFALRKARELMNAQIEAETGWNVQNRSDYRLKQYESIAVVEQLTGVFMSNILSSVGKQSINDVDTDTLSFGDFLIDTKVAATIGMFLKAIPPTYYRAFKQWCPSV